MTSSEKIIKYIADSDIKSPVGFRDNLVELNKVLGFVKENKISIANHVLCVSQFALSSKRNSLK